MMVDADRLRIVFFVNGVGFVIPVADLLAIQSLEEDNQLSLSPSPPSLNYGTMIYRETDVSVFSLAVLFALGDQESSRNGQILVFAGSDCPWAVKVDQVEGVQDVSLFDFCDLPVYMLRNDSVPYRQVAIRDGQLLVSVEPAVIEQAFQVRR